MQFKKIFLTAAAFAATAPAFAQANWPTKPITLVVPFAAGGPTDVVARTLGASMTKTLGQTVVIENKLGAGGAIGVDYAVNAPQDGYTILFVGSTLFTVLPIANKVNYEPLKDLVPVSITGTNGMVMVVQKDAPYSTLKEFIDYARKNPGKIT